MNIAAAIAISVSSMFIPHDVVFETVKHHGNKRAEAVLSTKTLSVQSMVGNAYAEFHPGENECLVKVGKEIKTAGDESFALNPIWPKFLAYHEFAHCDLYGEPTQLLGTSHNKIQSDLFDAFVQMHMIKLDDDLYEGLTINPVVAYHELFADAVALMKMRKDGHTAEQLTFVRVMRNAAAFSRTHDTLFSVNAVLAKTDAEISAMSTKQIFTEAKRLAAIGLLKKLALTTPTGDGSSYMLGQRFKSQFTNTIVQSERGELKTESYVAGDNIIAGMDVLGYPLVAAFLSKESDPLQKAFSINMDEAVKQLTELSVTLEQK